MNKENWIERVLDMPGCCKAKCDVCGHTRHGVASLMDGQFKCVFCLADEHFAKPKPPSKPILNVEDFARI